MQQEIQNYFTVEYFTAYKYNRTSRIGGYMTLNQVLRHYGTKAAAAKAIGQTRGSATKWDKAIPYMAQRKLEAASGGKLKTNEKLLTGKVK